MLWTIHAAEKTSIVDYSKHDKIEWFNNTMYTDCKTMGGLRWAKLKGVEEWYTLWMAPDYRKMTLSKKTKCTCNPEMFVPN